MFLGNKPGQNEYTVQRPIETCKVGKFAIGSPPSGNVSQTLPPEADYTGGWDTDPLCLGGLNWKSCRDGHTGVMCQVSPPTASHPTRRRNGCKSAPTGTDCTGTDVHSSAFCDGFIPSSCIGMRMTTSHVTQDKRWLDPCTLQACESSDTEFPVYYKNSLGLCARCAEAGQGVLWVTLTLVVIAALTSLVMRVRRARAAKAAEEAAAAGKTKKKKKSKAQVMVQLCIKCHSPFLSRRAVSSTLMLPLPPGVG